MKTILSLLLLLITIRSVAQESTASIEHMNMNVLYRGFDNKIVIGSGDTDFSRLYISAHNATATLNGDHYVVRPGNGKTATLEIIAVKDDGTEVTLRSKEFRISNLPDPKLYWGWAESGKAVQNQKPVLSAGYGKYYPFDPEFNVTSWEAMYNGEMFSGEGQYIAAIDDIVQNFTELTEFTIEAMVKGPDGISRKISGTWFVRPMLEE